MGNQTIINGYIEARSEHDAYNRNVIATFDFDEVAPFPNCFSPPHRGYRGSLIAFAVSLKAVEEEWPAWQQRFEALLGSLKAYGARVDFEETERSPEASDAEDAVTAIERGPSLRSARSISARWAPTASSAESTPPEKATTIGPMSTKTADRSAANAEAVREVEALVS